MSKNSRSKVHPNYKARHRVRNWAEYDQTLVQRGDLTIWFTPETISAWQPRAEGLRGGQRRYSDVAIETALTLRVLYRLPWRQTEGLLRSIFKLLGLELSAPDHTTLSRRAGGLQVELRRLLTTEPVHLIVDATGLGIVGQGQWAAAKWGERGRRGWRKLHIAVDESGRVLAAELTDRRVADAEMLPGLMDQVVGPIRRLTADGGYDTREVHAAAGARGASVVIPPRRDAVVTGEPVFEQRDTHVERIAEIGRRRWRVEAGQHAQARAENTFSRYKRLFGGRLRARGEMAQRNEALTACNILNRMSELGMPRSERIATA
jgi:transposase